MIQKVVILIRSNPQESHRACEGIRIALGLASGEHEVEVVLTEKAPLLLAPDVHEYVDGEMTEKFLSTLKEFIPVFYIKKEGANEVNFSDSTYETAHLTADEVAAKIAASDCVAVF